MVVLLIILFTLGAVILKQYIIPIVAVGATILLLKIYSFWVVKEFVARIGTDAADNVDSLPTVCGENEEFTKL